MFEELITSIPEIKADKLALKPGIRVKLRRDGHSETLAAAHKMKLEDEGLRDWEGRAACPISSASLS